MNEQVVCHSLDNLNKDDDDVPDTNGEEEFEEQNPDDYKSTVSGNCIYTCKQLCL